MILDRIKALCAEKGTTIKQLEVNTGIANGVIRKWDTSSPRLEYVVKVADYFGVSVDYLLGKTNNPFSADIVEIATMPNRDETEQQVIELLAQMPPEMKKAAVEQLKALAALNKK